MIINFSIQNFGSIKDEQTLSFEANKSTHLEEAYVVEIGKYRLLKLALIYGANASGKTTILKALDFLRNIVLEPESKKTEALHFQPFLFDPNTPKQNSTITIEFLQQGVKYLYKIEFFKRAIVAEELYFYQPKKANVFKRVTNIDRQYTKITFGSKISVDEFSVKTLVSNTLWNNTVLGGYLKTNINIKELQEAINWFSEYLNPLVHTTTKLEGFVTENIDDGKISKKDVVYLLKKADLHISDIVIDKEEQEIPDDLIDFLKNLSKDSNHQLFDLEKKDTITAVDIKFEHTVNSLQYTLPIEDESQGTLRYYGFAGLLALLVKNATIFPIDELESSLHPDLYVHFLLSFLLNAEQSQLIATTHHREILGNKDIFRNDAIWFTDKDNLECATELYSLADFDSSVIRDTTNVLNAYKSGKLSATPHLGDTFID